jgi:uncharacterized protein (DUF433 family)
VRGNRVEQIWPITARGAVYQSERGHCHSFGFRSNSGTIAMMQLEQIVHRDPEILSGTPVFRGTRVPIRSPFDYLEGGDTLNEFLRQFPALQRGQAIALLRPHAGNPRGRCACCLTSIYA